MEMTCGLGFKILLICLVQAHLLCFSWAKNAPTLQRIKRTTRGVLLPDGRTSSDMKTIQGQRDHYSFRPPYQSAELAPSLKKQRNPATLFKPVGSGPSSSVRMQTYAQAPGRRVTPKDSKTKRNPFFSPQAALNSKDFRSRNQMQLSRQTLTKTSRVEDSAPGFAPVMIHEIPELLGGSPIRRLKSPTDQKVNAQKPQNVQTPPQRKNLYKPNLSSFQSGSDGTRQNQNQGSVQKPQQAQTPPQRVPLYKPNLSSFQSGSDRNRQNQNQGSLQKLQQVQTPPQRKNLYKPNLTSFQSGSDRTRQNQNQGSLQKLQQVQTPPQRVPLYKPKLTSFQSGSDRNREKQNQGSLQKLQQVQTPPQRKNLYKPNLTSFQSGSDRTRQNQNQGSVQKPQQVQTPPQRVPLYKPKLTSFQSGSDRNREKENQGSVQKPKQGQPFRFVPNNNQDPSIQHPASKWTRVKLPHQRL
ncbi:putative uncharacterized protein DDB_G0288537 [Cyprinodon tularosa]|uniref:putative uncharacterized protein DDB_G0288537 n=1 Tax=Cyprinodon tularosa TaxID=77115 RepID=UPI0018E274FB|nr:putative uncharacterized protein DDB_G0288537 [Cyprinodon tularosa]